MATKKVSNKFIKKSSGPSTPTSSVGSTYRKMIAFQELVKASDPGSSGSSLGVNEAKTSVIKAVLGGQYDVQALSTFSGLPVPEVIAILQEIKGFGKSFNEVKV